jgi:hypothetical protein
MSITIGEGIALFRAGKSLLGGVRQAFQNRPGGNQAQQIQAFRTALEQRIASQRTSSPSANGALNAAPIDPTQSPNQQRISATLAALERALGKVFSTHPIDASKPAVLQLHGDRIDVTNGHLDKARLEALFADHPHLQQLVHRLDIALRTESGFNSAAKKATTLTLGPNGLSAALLPH